MVGINHYELIDELLSKSITKDRMFEIRKILLDYIFSFGDSSVFEELIYWDNHFQARVTHNERNIEIPGNREDIAYVSIVIDKLENLSKK